MTLLNVGKENSGHTQIMSVGNSLSINLYPNSINCSRQYSLHGINEKK